MPDTIFGSNGRLFSIEDGASPARVAEYHKRARAGAVSWGQGSLTPIRLPSDTQYGEFETVAIQRGGADLPSWNIEVMMDDAASAWLKLVRKGCSFDVHLNVGTCQNPRDFNGGWTFRRILEDAFPSSYDTNDMMVFDADADAPVLETIPISGEQIYDVKQIRPAEQAGDQATDEIVGIVVADAISCGACGAPSDGCSVVLAVTSGVTGSPGLPTEVLFTVDGGATWSETAVTSMALADLANDIASIGDYIVVTTASTDALHYALLADILTGTETWASITTGLDASGGPNKITTANPTASWISAEAGRIYFTADPTAGVTEQADGTLTSEDLAGIHALDEDNVVAVGASNVVLVTANGGATWTLVTGPAVGVALNTVWMRTSLEWLIGDAAGNLWYTVNAGTTWVAKTFPQSGSGQIRHIVFATKSVGYMAHDIATGPAGRILRTLDGGNSWYRLPEETSVTFPANDRVTALAACGYADPNVVYGGGLGDDGSDGFIVKVA